MNLLSRRVAAYLDELVPRVPRARRAGSRGAAHRVSHHRSGDGTPVLLADTPQQRSTRLRAGLRLRLLDRVFARAVKEDGGGIVHHVVWDDRLSQAARENLAALGVADVVQFHVGEAVLTLQQAADPFDVIFNDIDKRDYPKALDVITTKLRPGGLLLVDNMLWSGRIFERATRALRPAACAS